MWPARRPFWSAEQPHRRRHVAAEVAEVVVFAAVVAASIAAAAAASMAAGAMAEVMASTVRRWWLVRAAGGPLTAVASADIEIGSIAVAYRGDRSQSSSAPGNRCALLLSASIRHCAMNGGFV